MAQPLVVIAYPECTRLGTPSPYVCVCVNSPDCRDTACRVLPQRRLGTLKRNRGDVPILTHSYAF